MTDDCWMYLAQMVAERAKKLIEELDATCKTDK